MVLMVSCAMIGSSKAGLDERLVSRLADFGGGCDLLFLPLDLEESSGNLTMYPSISHPQLEQIQVQHHYCHCSCVIGLNNLVICDIT